MDMNPNTLSRLRSTRVVSTLLLLALLLAALPALGAEKKEVVNVNEASESQLALLPRVGPSIAARIVEFREANGKFKQPEDLMLVRGIGEKTFALMEPYVAVSGDTTLTVKAKAAPLAPADGGKEKTEG